MTVYLDTSTVLRVLRRQPKPLAIWARWERAYASELVHVEACRVIDRLRLGGALDDQGVAEVLIAKHRNGPIGKVRLVFLSHYPKFANMTRSERAVEQPAGEAPPVDLPGSDDLRDAEEG